MTQLVNGVPTAVLLLSVEEMQALSDYVHGRKQIRMDPNATWTAEKHIALCAHIDGELALLKAETCLSKKILSY